MKCHALKIFISKIKSLNAQTHFSTRKAEVLNSLAMNITAKANDTNDILQTFR